jgi:hypothetical protein
MERLRSEGSEVLATARHYRELDQLATLKRIELNFVGERAGGDLSGQLRASLNRMRDLLPIVESFRPDVSISVASFDCARIAFGLRIKHIAVNDSPHSVVADKLAIPLSHHLITPWLIPYNAWSRYGIARRAISRYRALDPAAWLKRRGGESTPRTSNRRGQPRLVVRLEESYAPYMIGSDASWGERLLDKVVSEFSDYEITVLTRYEDQLERITQLYSDKCKIPREVVDGVSLLEGTDLFIGMGGTMTTEAALMGVPSISAFQGGELYTEKYLIAKGILRKSNNPREIVKLGRQLVQRERWRVISRKAKAVLDSMEDPVECVAKYLSTLAS